MSPGCGAVQRYQLFSAVLLIIVLGHCGVHSCWQAHYNAQMHAVNVRMSFGRSNGYCRQDLIYNWPHKAGMVGGNMAKGGPWWQNGAFFYCYSWGKNYRGASKVNFIIAHLRHYRNPPMNTGQTGFNCRVYFYDGRLVHAAPVNVFHGGVNMNTAMAHYDAHCVRHPYWKRPAIAKVAPKVPPKVAPKVIPKVYANPSKQMLDDYQQAVERANYFGLNCKSLTYNLDDTIDTDDTVITIAWKLNDPTGNMGFFVYLSESNSSVPDHRILLPPSQYSLKVIKEAPKANLTVRVAAVPRSVRFDNVTIKAAGANSWQVSWSEPMMELWNVHGEQIALSMVSFTSLTIQARPDNSADYKEVSQIKTPASNTQKTVKISFTSTKPPLILVLGQIDQDLIEKNNCVGTNEQKTVVQSNCPSDGKQSCVLKYGQIPRCMPTFLDDEL